MARRKKKKNGGAGPSPGREAGRVALETALLAHAGAAAAGQVAKQNWFKNKDGKSRAHLVNYAGGVAGTALLMNKPSKNSRRVAAVLLGMSAGQLAIKSYTDWNVLKKKEESK